MVPFLVSLIASEPVDRLMPLGSETSMELGNGTTLSTTTASDNTVTLVRCNPLMYRAGESIDPPSLLRDRDFLISERDTALFFYAESGRAAATVRAWRSVMDSRAGVYATAYLSEFARRMRTRGPVSVALTARRGNSPNSLVALHKHVTMIGRLAYADECVGVIDSWAVILSARSPQTVATRLQRVSGVEGLVVRLPTDTKENLEPDRLQADPNAILLTG